MSRVYYSLPSFSHILTFIFFINIIYIYIFNITLMSSSSEIADSGNFSCQNIVPVDTKFSKTCNPFSQENDSFPDLTLGRRVTTPSTTTMDLFPMTETPRSAVEMKQEESSSSMTIFYNGQVIVFNDLAPEKANQIMKLAEKSVCQTQVMKQDDVVKNNVLCPQPVASGSDLPIARKASLTRFLEKRKERLTYLSPYQGQAISKEDDTKSWLGLSAQSHIQFQSRS